MLLDNFIQIYKYIVIVGFVISLFGFWYNAGKDKRYGINIKAISFAILGIGLIFSYFILTDEMNSKSQSEISKILYNTKIKEVYFNNHSLDTSKHNSVLLILKSLNEIEPHHSSPQDNGYYLKVYTESDSIILKLYPDSDIKNEFWVYNKKYKTTSITEMGRIKTDLFNEILNN